MLYSVARRTETENDIAAGAAMPAASNSAKLTSAVAEAAQAQPTKCAALARDSRLVIHKRLDTW